MTPFEQRHSFDCWGSVTKVHREWFNLGHRRDLMWRGSHHYKWMMLRIKDLRKAEESCPECSLLTPEKRSSREYASKVECLATVSSRPCDGVANTDLGPGRPAQLQEHSRRGRSLAHICAPKRGVTGRRKRRKDMATATKVTVSAAQAFRDSLKVKTLKTDEAIIAYVRKQSGSKTFNDKTLAWYRSMHKQGKLAKKGHAASAN